MKFFLVALLINALVGSAEGHRPKPINRVHHEQKHTRSHHHQKRTQSHHHHATVKSNLRTEVKKVTTRSFDAELAALDDKLKRIVEEYKVKGASMSFFLDGVMDEPVLFAYGHTSSDDTEEVTVDTAFQVASVSKVFVGVALTKLLAENQIDLDDDICDVLPQEYHKYDDWKNACRNRHYPDTKVTWRMLATHISSLIYETWRVKDGIEAHDGPCDAKPLGDVEKLGGGNCPLTDVTGFYRDVMIDKDTETNVGECIENIRWSDEVDVWENWEPGTNYSYSNFATGYASGLIEHKTGMSFEQFTQENIFDKLGMTNTAWHANELEDRGVTVANPTFFLESQGKWEDFTPYCMIDFAAGELTISARDASKFLHSMMDYGAPDLWDDPEDGKKAFECQLPNQVGKTNLRECEIRKDDEDGDGVPDGFVSGLALYWGMAHGVLGGWIDDGLFNWDHAVDHSGGLHGTQSYVLVLPESKMYLSVFFNTEYPGDSPLDDALEKLSIALYEFGMTLKESGGGGDGGDGGGGGVDDDDDDA